MGVMGSLLSYPAYSPARFVLFQKYLGANPLTHSPRKYFGGNPLTHSTGNIVRGWEYSTDVDVLGVRGRVVKTHCW